MNRQATERGMSDKVGARGDRALLAGSANATYDGKLSMRARTLLLAAVALFCSAACGDDPVLGRPSQTLTGQETYQTLKLDSLVIPPGQEQTMCQDFVNPFGEEVWLSGIDSTMTKHSHHLLVFSGTMFKNKPLASCNTFEAGTPIYGTQIPEDKLAYPSGIAFKLKANEGIRIQAHYLNSEDTFLPVNVNVKLTRIPRELVKQRAGVLLLSANNINLAPHSDGSVSADCSLGTNVNVITAAGHMHSRGTHFKADVGDKTVYESTNWDNARTTVIDPAVSANSGTKVTFGCSFENKSDQSMSFGLSARDNEMCVLYMQFYPLPFDLEGSIGCQGSATQL